MRDALAAASRSSMCFRSCCCWYRSSAQIWSSSRTFGASYSMSGDSISPRLASSTRIRRSMLYASSASASRVLAASAAACSTPAGLCSSAPEATVSCWMNAESIRMHILRALSSAPGPLSVSAAATGSVALRFPPTTRPLVVVTLFFLSSSMSSGPQASDAAAPPCLCM